MSLDDLTAARVGRIETSKPEALPRAVPRLSALPRRKHKARHSVRAVEERMTRAAECSRSIEARREATS